MRHSKLCGHTLSWIISEDVETIHVVWQTGLGMEAQAKGALERGGLASAAIV
jgi:hypothetical protein